MHTRGLFVTLTPIAVFGMIVLQSLLEVDIPSTQLGQVAFATELESPEPQVHATTSVLFTGDLMLGRGVEAIRESTDVAYYFGGLDSYLKQFDSIVVNFEGSIPQKHQPTESMELRFSVPQSYVPELKLSGITFASLANNHALDHGADGYTYTEQMFEENDILSFGHPTNINSDSVRYMLLDDVVVAVIGINETFGTVERDALAQVIHEATLKSDLQIMFIHWGDEYKNTHNRTQESIAHFAIDEGIDLILGHHPHVVQDIDIYNDRLVFYSLGNFVFDQFFSDDVQSGLLVALHKHKDSLLLNLVPITSIGSKTQPRIMPAYEATLFLKRLAKKSNEDLSQDILAGWIDVSDLLATSP